MKVPKNISPEQKNVSKHRTPKTKMPPMAKNEIAALDELREEVGDFEYYEIIERGPYQGIILKYRKKLLEKQAVKALLKCDWPEFGLDNDVREYFFNKKWSTEPIVKFIAYKGSTVEFGTKQKLRERRLVLYIKDNGEWFKAPSANRLSLNTKGYDAEFPNHDNWIVKMFEAVYAAFHRKNKRKIPPEILLMLEAE